MAVSVATWNIKEGLAQSQDMPRVVEQIKEIDADVMVLSDAYSIENDLHGSDKETLLHAYDVLETAGYARAETEYDDAAQWRHDRNIIVLSRLATSQSNVIRLSSRNAIEVHIQDNSSESIHIIGAHFDDRSEATRLGHVGVLAELTDMSVPTVLAGSLNTMHRTDVVAKMARSPFARYAVGAIPGRNLQQSTEIANNAPERIKSVATRLMDMASGEAMDALEEMGFRDADLRHRPTWRRFQLANSMVSEAVAVTDFRVFDPLNASDHRAVRAQLEL